MSHARFAVGAVVSMLSIAVIGAASFPLVTETSAWTQQDEPVRIGGEVTPPRKTKHVDPQYPPEAKEAGIEGVVVLEVVDDRDGKVADARVSRSVPELDQAALDAVRQWEFEPTDVEGKAVRVGIRTLRPALKPEA